MNAIKVPLVQRRQVSEKVLEVTCEIHEQRIQFNPGQYFKVGVENLLFPDQKGNTRIFNAVSSPNNEHYITFAFLMSDSGFKKTIIRIPLGTDLEIKGPYGMFTIPKNESRHIVMIGDGIGITPCMSLILYAIEEEFANEMHLFYSSNCPYSREIKEIQQENKNLRCMEFNDLDLATIKKIDNYKECVWYVSGTIQRTAEIKRQLLKASIPIQNIQMEEFAGY